MDTFFRLASREQRLQLIYLLAATGVLTFLVNLIAFQDHEHSRIDAIYLSDYIRSKEKLLKDQLNNLSLLDSAYRAIVAYQPQVNAIFVEADIEAQLNEIRRLSTPQADGTRFRAYAQIADFYQMMYVDKKLLWSKESNINLFQKQLDDCGAGIVPVTTAAAPITTR